MCAAHVLRMRLGAVGIVSSSRLSELDPGSLQTAFIDNGDMTGNLAPMLSLGLYFYNESRRESCFGLCPQT